jgi:hypothetical protein
VVWTKSCPQFSSLQPRSRVNYVHMSAMSGMLMSNMQQSSALQCVSRAVTSWTTGGVVSSDRADVPSRNSCTW